MSGGEAASRRRESNTRSRLPFDAALANKSRASSRNVRSSSSEAPEGEASCVAGGCPMPPAVASSTRGLFGKLSEGPSKRADKARSRAPSFAELANKSATSERKASSSSPCSDKTAPPSCKAFRNVPSFAEAAKMLRASEHTAGALHGSSALRMSASTGCSEAPPEAEAWSPAEENAAFAQSPGEASATATAALCNVRNGAPSSTEADEVSLACCSPAPTPWSSG
mmetsp:Transcript_84396/g.243610  ORF Transcript_84396/g.243610 Transcript_84396/m.243610 type:complete len:225 (+) Transcript_84396:2843-3517(+)